MEGKYAASIKYKYDLDNEYIRIIFERYDPGDNPDYTEENNFLWLLNAPEQYQVELEMLEYIKEHPDADTEELLDYFDVVAPSGLPPGDDGSDLLDDDFEDDE